MVVPLIVLVAIGRIDWAAYASFGAMTSLYGRSEPYLVRAPARASSELRCNLG